ncbi:MAG TPA: hypothetical protein GXX25_08025 [Desulfotomaculum sp.]|nr:hypothetical protein [Desulfotomaculum sp.]
MQQLTINKKIQVAREGERDWYASTIQDIKNGEIYIALPRLRGNALILSPGDNVQVRYAEESASFVFPARCLGRTEDSVPLYRLARTGEIQRVQQRSHVRLKTTLEVHYAHQPAPNRRPRYKRAYTVDMSGGGMRLAVNEPVQAGVELLLQFTLPLREGPRKMELKGRVVRLFAMEDGGHHVALEFVDITTAQQDLIVRYIFQRMGEQARLR